MDNTSLKRLGEVIELKDKITTDLLNLIIDEKENLYISNVSINHIIDYFYDTFRHLEELSPNEFDDLDYETQKPYLAVHNIMHDLNILDEKYSDLTNELKGLLNNNQFDFNKIHRLLTQIDSNTKQGFAENALTLNKVNNTVERIERDANPKPEKYNSKEDFLAALARSDAEKL